MLVSRPDTPPEPVRIAGSHPRQAPAPAVARNLATLLDKAPDLTAKLDALRRFKHREEIRIGMADLLVEHAAGSGLPRAVEARGGLSRRRACACGIGNRQTVRAAGVARGLAVIGVGKLGGRELTYGSDLDILFVFTESRAAAPPAGLTVFEYFSKVAEKTISYLSTLTREGFVFRVDTRLRPTGSKGPLVQSIDAFKNYYARQAETWERQALLRAQVVAGDRVVGREFCLIHRRPDLPGCGPDLAGP